jgi:hypothetical protein
VRTRFYSAHSPFVLSLLFLFLSPPLLEKEVASDAFDQKPVAGYKGVREIQSKKIVIQEAEIDIGANASKGDGEGGDDEGDEGVEASEAQTVINVVHAAKLQKMELSQKVNGMGERGTE